MKEPQDGCDTGCGENKLLPAESGKQKYATRAITFLRWTEHKPKQLINTTYWDPEQNPTRHWFASRLRSCPLLCSARKKIPFGVTKIIFQWSEKHSSNNQSMSFTLVFFYFLITLHIFIFLLAKSNFRTSYVFESTIQLKPQIIDLAHWHILIRDGHPKINGAMFLSFFLCLLP